MTGSEFKERFMPSSKMLYRQAFRLVGNAQDAEDLVQEVYLKLWIKRDQLWELTNIDAYLISVMRNMWLDNKRRRSLDMSDTPLEDWAMVDNSTPEQSMIAKDEVGKVMKVMDDLSENQRKIVLMKDRDGYSTEEITKATGLNAFKIKQLLFRGRTKIREQLKKNKNYESKGN